MQLTKLRLLNFKCFRDSGDIPLAPLTLVFGKNNSGKSSILQSLLLLRQTLDSPQFGSRLNLRGPLHPTANYGDIVHQHKFVEDVTMQFELSSDEGKKAGNLELQFSSGEPQPPRLTRLSVVGNESVPLEFRTGRGAGGPYRLYLDNEDVGGEEDAHFSFPVSRFFPLIGEEPPRVGRPSEKRQRSRDFANAALSALVERLLSLKMVGAFRRQPIRRYEYLGPVPDQVDAAGEYVINALIEDFAYRRRNRGELVGQVNRWLRAVGRVRLLPFRRISRTARIFEIRLRDTDSKRWANFADVGFGIGQALPVLVEGLRTAPRGLFIVQEPEIHLHPDAQLRMADFLVSLVRSGRRVIAETHSEHILLRVRRSVLRSKSANGDIPRLDASEVRVVFVEKQPDGTSHTRALRVDELGQVENWPAGFMEEATQERLAILEDMTEHNEMNP
jgi:predicted ATPase